MRMPASPAIAAGLVAAALLLGACGGSAATPAAPTTPAAQPTPVASDGSSSAWLRMTTSQAIPPADQFAAGPAAVITADGTLVVAGPVDAMYPGPLLPNLIGRPISDAGRARILEAARGLGLLAGPTDFTGDGIPPGGVTGRIELLGDGQRVTLVGDPTSRIECVTTPCDPPPGTPAAFGAFWASIVDGGLLEDDLGPEAPFVPDSYAILVGPPPEGEPGAPIADWPLEVALGSFGVPVAEGLRCGIATGDDAVALHPALAEANQATQWVQDVTTSATFGLTVRPIIAGEDPCAEAFGGG
jgi:hypothetical protein